MIDSNTSKISNGFMSKRYHAVHKEVYKWFNISFDEFGRTSSPQQTEVCQAIFMKLLENKWLSENTMQQLYCDTCKRFLADRLVEGTCPTQGCNYDSARGDQCENCGKLLNPTELQDPRCKVCRNTPRIRDTDHLFLELPLLKDKLEEYINRMSVAGSWSQNAIQATNAWLKEGLKPRCITRDLKWGVPVPNEKFKDKVFYVWFDAPIGYVSITSCYTSEWEKWWKNPENVELYQFMGKDNVPFHTVMFPSTLLGTGENWTLMKTISVTEYLNYETGKFSKSRGIGVFGNDAKDTNIPVEVSDTLFTWADLQAKLNSELLNNLGNFINRVLSFIAKDPALEDSRGVGYHSIIPDAPGAELHQLTKTFGEKIGDYVQQYLEAMEKVKLKQGLKTAMSISGEGNAYLQESQFWKLYKEDQPSCSVVMKTSAGLVYLLSCLLEPFMPSFSLEVLKQLNLPAEMQVLLSDEKGDIERAKRPWEFLPAGHKIGIPEPLFKELKDEEVEIFRQKFAGSQADRILKAEAEAKDLAEQLKKTKVSDPPIGSNEIEKSRVGGLDLLCALNHGMKVRVSIFMEPLATTSDICRWREIREICFCSWRVITLRASRELRAVHSNVCRSLFDVATRTVGREPAESFGEVCSGVRRAEGKNIKAKMEGIGSSHYQTPLVYRRSRTPAASGYRRSYRSRAPFKTQYVRRRLLLTTSVLSFLTDGRGKKQQPTKSVADAKFKGSVEAEVSVSRLDIRVGLITKAQKHPDADSLYVEEIDVGEGQPRTVVSGLVNYIPLDDMQNRKVCVLCNIKPTTMRGIKSQAMVLAASDSDHTKVELVEPPQSAPVGERVTFPGFKGDPDDILNPKKKVWETVQVDLHTDKELVACYKDVPFTTSAGVCKVSSICGGSISFEDEDGAGSCWGHFGKAQE
ncbi:hypothetical protein TEA_026704 [Camellia sinensis var. sinensis]|uniref:methionine--tRNA ligase n=1 Tax=Camellia sinensis var. sinensis TaxID=542762 RepID=A0A4S4EQ39_CAMSN|nr:hypothetical protein TEA_026704 [Camellia sinensis var. sinensis]